MVQIYVSEKNVITDFHLLAVCSDLSSFSTKVSIQVISVGVERYKYNGTPKETSYQVGFITTLPVSVTSSSPSIIRTEVLSIDLYIMSTLSQYNPNTLYCGVFHVVDTRISPNELFLLVKTAQQERMIFLFLTCDTCWHGDSSKYTTDSWELVPQSYLYPSLLSLSLILDTSTDRSSHIKSPSHTIARTSRPYENRTICKFNIHVHVLVLRKIKLTHTMYIKRHGKLRAKLFPTY